MDYSRRYNSPLNIAIPCLFDHLHDNRGRFEKKDKKREIEFE